MPNLNVCGTIYPYPNVGDNPWGVPHIDWATAVSNCLTTLNTQVQTNVMPNPFTTIGDMLYADPTITPVRLGIGAIGQVLTVAGSGLPSWQTPASGAVSVPIGSIISWNDFNGVLALDPNYRYCDGSVINAPGSPIDGLTTDDLSGAYIVGYGTLGAGDIGTAPYDITPVGNPNHQIAINHTHSHSHTHAGPSHTHGNGTLKFKVAEAGYNGGATGFLDMFTSNGTQVNILDGTDFNLSLGGSPVIISVFDVNNDPTSDFYTVNGSGQTSSGGTGNTGGASTATTSSSLSSTQSIQPRSQRYRFIIRVL